MQLNPYELSVCVNGRPIREYGHRGLTYVEGRPGKNYSIKFRNNSAVRVLAVVSVDCVDVVDGKAATDQSRGYIVPAYQSIEIHGWRTSKTTVNDFVFGQNKKSYSAQTQSGDQTNCGIVGVKVFGEVFTFDLTKFNTSTVHEHHHHHYPPPPPPPWTPWITYGGTASMMGELKGSYSASLDASLNAPIVAMNFTSCVTGATGASQSACASAAAPVAAAPAQENPSFNLGTEWGKERKDTIEEVPFTRGPECGTLAIYYSDAKGLQDAGIEVNKKPAVPQPTLPKAFHGFCTPPVVTSQS